MRPLMIVLVVVALGIAGTTALLAKRFLSQKEAPAAAAPSVATERVLVAARNVAAGAVLVDDDLRYESWPKGSIDKRFVVHGGGDDPKGKFVGSVAARAIAAGEPMTGPSVFRQDEAGEMSGMIAPGMRAVSVAINPTNAVSGFVNPGDRVDVVLLTKYKPKDKGKDKKDDGDFFVSEVMLKNLRVVAVDGNLKPGAQPSMQGKTATLEVTPKEAEALVIGAAAGSLHLVLRSRANGELVEEGAGELSTSVSVSRAVDTYSSFGGMRQQRPVEEAAPSVEASDGRQVKINRAGYTTTQSF